MMVNYYDKYVNYYDKYVTFSIKNRNKFVVIINLTKICRNNAIRNN